LTAGRGGALGLVASGYLGMNQVTAALFSLALALWLAWTMLRSLPDIAEYGVAAGWALVAVAVANLTGSWLVLGAAGLGAAILAIRTLPMMVPR